MTRLEANITRALRSALLLAVVARSAAAQTRDTSRHRMAFVDVRGVRVPWLDWGGQGQALVFIPGFTNSAHVYDDFAPRFTDRFRVLGVTRVGFGESDQPADSGYSLAERVAHIRAVLDSAHVDRAILVGHSLGGDEITAFAVAHPERTIALVYLDAALDHVKALQWEGVIGPFFQNAPGPTPDELRTPTGFQRYVKQLRGIELPIGEILATNSFDSTGAVAGPRAAGYVFQRSMEAVRPPDFARVRVPVLALYSEKTAGDVMPWLRGDTGTFARADAVIRNQINPAADAERAAFERAIPGAVVQSYPAHHYQFLVTPDDTERRMRAFFSTLASSRPGRR